MPVSAHCGKHVNVRSRTCKGLCPGNAKETKSCSRFVPCPGKGARAPPPVLRTNLHSYNIVLKFRAISSSCFMDNQRNGLETHATGLVTSVLRPDTHYFGMKARATIRSKKWGTDSKIRTSWGCFSNFLKHLTLNQYFQILKAHLI